MINEYNNVQNPMLGAFLLWNFVLGYYVEGNEFPPFEEIFIVLPMIMKEEILNQINSTRKTSGIRVMLDKFKKKEFLKNDLISGLHYDIRDMFDLTMASFSESIKAGLLSVDLDDNTIIPIEFEKNTTETKNIIQMAKNAEKLGIWCSKLSLIELEEVLKVRF